MLDSGYFFRLTDYKQSANKNQELLARVNKNQYVRIHIPPEADQGRYLKYVRFLGFRLRQHCQFLTLASFFCCCC
jgi:hypothetical protein